MVCLECTRIDSLAKDSVSRINNTICYDIGSILDLPVFAIRHETCIWCSCDNYRNFWPHWRPLCIGRNVRDSDQARPFGNDCDFLRFSLRRLELGAKQSCTVMRNENSRLWKSGQMAGVCVTNQNTSASARASDSECSVKPLAGASGLY